MPDAGRVVAGSARGLRLEAPPEGTRALTDRVKESLFGALEAAGALRGPFLDLFAGSGAGGIEALSRRAPAATFVERDGRACQVIGENLRRARLEANGHVVRADVVSFLDSGTAATRTPFAVALVDPPYGDDVIERTLELLADPARRWLTEAGLIVAKHFWRDDPPETAGDLYRTRQRRFGETVLSFYTRKRRTDHGGTP
jgi:16S rRNA (guanine966-N2)-methyltransferase